MSLQIFPALPGLGWSVHKKPSFSTRIASHISGREVRAANMAYPIWEFDLTYELLRAGAEQELQTLIGFFLENQGRFTTFLYPDPSENPVTGQILGEGDGTTVLFPFIRTLGGFIEPVLAVEGTPAVYVNGVAAAGNYSLQPGPLGVNSIIAFTSAPPAGAVISADFSFYYNCRFAGDIQDFENFAWRLWTMQSCKLRSVKI